MDLDLFLEDDIPNFLDGFEKGTQKEKASANDINNLLSPAEQQAKKDAEMNKEFDPSKILDTGKIELKADAVTVQVGDETHSYEAEQKNPDIIDALVQRAAKAKPHQQIGVYSEALTAIDNGERKKAISLLSGLLENNPHNVAYRTRLADALRLPGGESLEDSPLPESPEETPPAPTFPEEEIQEEPKVSPSMYRKEHMLSRYMKAVHLLRTGKTEKAKSLFVDLAKENPHNLAVQIHLQELGDNDD